jgi:hypothetical protein
LPFVRANRRAPERKRKAVAEGVLREDYGLVGDAHADCCTHRQLSLLAMESIDKVKRMGFVRGKRMNVYTHAGRITRDEE